jgi:hypothetical protein
MDIYCINSNKSLLNLKKKKKKKKAENIKIL